MRFGTPVRARRGSSESGPAAAVVVAVLAIAAGLAVALPGSPWLVVRVLAVLVAGSYVAVGALALVGRRRARRAGQTRRGDPSHRAALPAVAHPAPSPPRAVDEHDGTAARDEDDDERRAA